MEHKQMRLWAIPLLISGLAILHAQEPAAAAPGSLTLEEVVSLSKVTSEDAVVARIKRNAKPFDLNADQIVELKNSGVSDLVVKYLIDPSLPYPPPPPPGAAPAPAAPPPPPPPKSRPTTDPLALKLPPDPGVYYLSGADQFTPLARKTVVPYKQPGKITALSAGLVKGHVIGSVVGPTAATRVSGSSSVYYLRLPEKAMIDDFTLVMLDKAKDRRDLDFGTKPGKVVFRVESVKPFSPQEVGTGIYRLSVGMLKKGEYFFFIRGSGDDKKGLLGEGYELGVN